jgi:signal peptidase I
MEITAAQFKELKTRPFFKGTLVSSSMEPVIKVGDNIVVEVNAQNLKRFDIIVIYQDGKLIAHFIWSINKVVKPILYQTRNLLGHYDFPITEEDYLGRVVSHRITWFRKIRLLF